MIIYYYYYTIIITILHLQLQLQLHWLRQAAAAEGPLPHWLRRGDVSLGVYSAKRGFEVSLSCECSQRRQLCSICWDGA